MASEIHGYFAGFPNDDLQAKQQQYAVELKPFPLAKKRGRKAYGRMTDAEFAPLNCVKTLSNLV